MFQERATVMFSWRDAVLQNTDIEAVHKMRVASRRLRAVMDAYEGIADPKIFKPVYKLVKKTADVLGAARDTDVMIQNLQAQLEQLPSLEQAGIRWLLNKLEAYRKDHQQALIAHINSLDEIDVMRQLEHCLRKER
jgi:CHAD domain-containing protein